MPTKAGGGNLIIGRNDLDGHTVDLYDREIVLEPRTVPSGQFRLAEFTDPSGNAITSPRNSRVKLLRTLTRGEGLRPDHSHRANSVRLDVSRVDPAGEHAERRFW